MKYQISVFKQLQATTSRLSKESIINEHKDDEFFCSCLNFLLNPFITTGIDVKKWDKVVIEDSDWAHTDDISQEFLTILDFVKENNSGKVSVVESIKGWCYDLDEEVQEFTRSIITKGLRLGVDAKIVNKCIPNFIPVFDVMLGTPISDCKLKGDEWISISRKLNGTRCAFVGEKLFTRQGKEYNGLNHIIKDLMAMGYGNNMFIDGELLYKNTEELSDSDAFQKGTGIAMSKDGDKSQLKLVVFDIFPLEEFYSGKSKETYLERKKYLNDIRNKIKATQTENLSVVPIVYQGTNHERIEHWLDYAEKHDWEGVMLNLNAQYECKRVKTLIKVKKFFSCDIRCVGVEEGTGRNEGTLGALICEYKGFKVNVGTGFSDDQRKDIWADPGSVIGKIISVKYKEETKNKNGTLSIQFPVFEAVRFDKNEESYN